MALGGGTFQVQNKVLPGSYMNFVSAKRAILSFADRGYTAIPLILDWGIEGEVFTVENADFETNTKKIFGYSYEHEKMRGLRDLFKNAKTLYVYRVNDSTKAVSSVANARYGGTRGNDLKIVIQTSVDDITKFDVSTYLETSLVDVQTVKTAADLIDNDYIVFDKTITLAATAGTPLTGGTTGVATGDNYQTFLSKIEGYYINTLACLSTVETIKSLFVQYTKRMRDQVGAKFQLVGYRLDADYEGVISVENKSLTPDWNEASAVYWVAGAEAGCLVNKSVTNKVYDGEFNLECKENQTGLKEGIEKGKFLFHKVGDKLRVLTDINTFTSFTVEKNVDFSSNQTIRVLDQIAIDIATIFNTRYLGQVPNDQEGRIDLWKDIVKHHETLLKLRAIENFTDKDIEISKGEDKKSVYVIDNVTPVNCMEKLYMTVVVS